MDWRDRLARFAVSATLAKWAEALLLLLLIVQIARLFWSVVTPLGMVGEWQARRPAVLAPAARQALFAGFDPFFRTETASGAAQVTGLALQLFGTRMNEGSGQGSAIIATPDGVQSSFVAGDQIMPGVVLKEVAFDHVVIDRGGALENLFLDQSTGTEAPSSGSAAPPTDGRAPGQPDGAAPGALTPDVIARGVAFAPRVDRGNVSGIIVSSKENAEMFSRAGFEPGDIITQVNGRPITSAADLESLKAHLQPGARVSLMVERGAATVPIAIVLSGGQ